jgi:hypothetical protein
MLNEFLGTALWSSSDYENGDENNNPPLDEKYNISDISQEFKDKCQIICDCFMNKASHLFTDYEIENSPIGHDLWLTIEHHGCGFWDGDYENGDELTKIAHECSSELCDELNNSINRG